MELTGAKLTVRQGWTNLRCTQATNISMPDGGEDRGDGALSFLQRMGSRNSMTWNQYRHNPSLLVWIKGSLRSYGHIWSYPISCCISIQVVSDATQNPRRICSITQLLNVNNCAATREVPVDLFYGTMSCAEGCSSELTIIPIEISIWQPMLNIVRQYWPHLVKSAPIFLGRIRVQFAPAHGHGIFIRSLEHLQEHCK